MGRHKIHETKTQALHARDGKRFQKRAARQRGIRSVTCRGTWAADARCARSAISTSSTDSTLGTMMMAQPVSCLAHNGGDIVGKSRVIHRMDTSSYPSLWSRSGCQACHQRRMLGLQPDGRAIFTIEGDIKDAGTEFLRHLGLQLQAFAHARFDAAVVVADRQKWPVCAWAPSNTSRGWGTAQRPAPVQRRRTARRPDAKGVGCIASFTSWLYSRCLTPSCSPCSSASVMLMRSCENASMSRPSTILYSPFSQVTGKPNMVSLGMPYWPSEGMPMVTHLPLVPRAQSRMWSMAALAAEAQPTTGHGLR